MAADKLALPEATSPLRVLLNMRNDDSEKSFVGDPVFWPGLIYAPLNLSGLVFALGSISNMTGLIFEEFSESGHTAICRRRTGQGWERIKVALAVKSSEHDRITDNVDLLICWVDDSVNDSKPPVMELSAIGSRSRDRMDDRAGDNSPAGTEVSARSSENKVEGDTEFGEFEETIRLLDEKIRKFKGG